MSSSELHGLARAQDRLAQLFGVQVDARAGLVEAMLRGPVEDAPGYWLSLVLAMGIATLGLALSSTAIIIGAMLVSPLMSPIVGLGMGLAVGSPLLVLSAFTRSVLSVAVVVGGAALLTLGLPFHEINAEISARTAPTVLDLSVAILCAIAGVYTTVRPGSSTSSTAAGTAIGISLVPPLCVVGYGLGIGAERVAAGAALLFTANFCAIVLFAVLGFLALGYNRIEVAALEGAEVERKQRGRWLYRFGQALSRLFHARYGAVFRVLMPLLLLAAVYLPLSHALEEVSWQVSVRAEIQRQIARLGQKVVRSSVTVERGRVDLALVAVGTQEDGATIERSLAPAIAAVAGVEPQLRVAVVPDAAALNAVAESLRARPSEPAPVVVRAGPELAPLRAEVDAALAGAWPQAAAGDLLAWGLRFTGGEARAELVVTHLGPPLGAAAEEVLATQLSRLLQSPVAVRGEPILPALALDAAEPDAVFAAMGPMLAALDAHGELRGCAEVEPGHPVAAALLDRLRAHPAASRISARLGPRLALELRRGTCPIGQEIPLTGPPAADAASPSAPN